MTCKWQVEIDPFARRVLEKHWPDVPKHDDVLTFPPSPPKDWYVDLICGGFPCQDISYAGKGAGIKAARSGLWSQFHRIVGELRPRFVLVENVAALLVRGLDVVLGELAEIGYDAEWDCLPAAAFGARHFRDRVFVVASARVLHDPHQVEARCFGGQGRARGRLPDAGIRHRIARGPWSGEPGISRVAHGIPHRLDRCERLGNAVVPQVAQFIGERIMTARTPRGART